jgi:hypothetical protein
VGQTGFEVHRTARISDGIAAVRPFQGGAIRMKHLLTRFHLTLLLSVLALAGGALVGFNNSASATGQTEFGLSNGNSWNRANCNPSQNEWHFIINGLAENGDTVWTAPATISVTWSDGTTTQVPQTNINKNEAGYTDTAHIALDVQSALAVIPLSADGRTLRRQLQPLTRPVCRNSSADCEQDSGGHQRPHRDLDDR